MPAAFLPAGASTVRVRGLRELQQAFKAADRTLQTDLRARLREVAEPVRTDAERLAASGIRRMTLPWSQMRVGVTQSSVYLAPRQRGTTNPQRRRPNLAGLLYGRSMAPALEQNEPLVIAGMDRLLADVGKAWERG